MTYQEAYDKLIKHAAEVEKWKQGMVKSHPNQQTQRKDNLCDINQIRYTRMR